MINVQGGVERVDGGLFHRDGVVFRGNARATLGIVCAAAAAERNSPAANSQPLRNSITCFFFFTIVVGSVFFLIFFFYFSPFFLSLCMFVDFFFV